MPLKSESSSPGLSAEDLFRLAFERLKVNQPERLPKGSAVSQNNVAREAGCDPSALRKSRYPSLIAEVQHWCAGQGTESPPSRRQRSIARRKRNRSLKEKNNDMKAQRDHAMSKLVEADAKILELTMETMRLKKLLGATD